MNSIAIFPLNVVLYPGSALPLKIFEQRYLAMVKHCLRDELPFGVCRIREGVEVGSPAVPETVGCTAGIAQWEMPHLGLFHLHTMGQHPFRILQKTIGSDGLVRAEIEYLEDSPGLIREESFAFCRRVLAQIIEKLGTDYFSRPLARDDPRWTSYRLADVLPLELEQKQALLELREDGARLETLRNHLQQPGRI